MQDHFFLELDIYLHNIKEKRHSEPNTQAPITAPPKSPAKNKDSEPSQSGFRQTPDRWTPRHGQNSEPDSSSVIYNTLMIDSPSCLVLVVTLE